MSRFKKATRTRARLRLGLCGPSGSGKTYTGLRLAIAIADARGKELGRPGRVAVIDSESGSASKYAGESPDGVPWDFDVLELVSFSPDRYTEALADAAAEKFDVVLIDSLSHAWEGKDGALEMVDKKKGQSGNSYTAWKDITPMHRRLVDTILTSPCDVICTLRAKTEYVLEPNEKGQMVPKKIGVAPIQRQGMEYEFDVFCDIDQSHILTVTKTRCNALDGAVVVKAGPGFARPLVEWLTTGEVVEVAQPVIRTDSRNERTPIIEKVLIDANRIGWDRKRLDSEVLAKYRHPLEEITLDELTELANRLARLPDKRPPVVETMDIPPKRVTDSQLQTIKALQTALFAVVPDKARQKEEWKSLLGRFKVDSARDLTEDDAKLFCVAVENRVKMIQEGGDPFGDPASVDTPANGTSDTAEATTPTTPTTPPTT
jgi:hypothetical protein